MHFMIREEERRTKEVLFFHNGQEASVVCTVCLYVQQASFIKDQEVKASTLCMFKKKKEKKLPS